MLHASKASAPARNLPLPLQALTEENLELVSTVVHSPQDLANSLPMLHVLTAGAPALSAAHLSLLD
jgi:hypothetical protein